MGEREGGRETLDAIETAIQAELQRIIKAQQVNRHELT